MTAPKVPDASITDLVLLPTDPSTLRLEVLAEIIRRRLVAALERLAVGSARQYEAALRNFARWFGSWSLENADHLTTFVPPEIVGAQAWWTIIGALFRGGPAISNEVADDYATFGCAGLRPATIAQRLAALRWAFRLGEEAGLIAWGLRVRGPRVTPYRDTRGPGLAALEALLRVIDRSKGLIAVRDAAMVGVLFVLGLRRGELVSLRVGDFDAQSRLLHVIGKGHSEPSSLSVPDALADELARYLALRGDPAPDAPLFASHDPARSSRGNGTLTANGLYRRILRLAKLAGLSRRVLPHGVRHTSITTALDASNGDLRSVRAFARHSKAETTIRYDDRRLDVAGRVAEQLSVIWVRSRAERSEEHKNAHSRALEKDRRDGPSNDDV